MWVGLSFLGCQNDNSNTNNNDVNGRSASVFGTNVNIQGNSFSYRLENVGDDIAYNIRYRLKISYKCNTGFATQPWLYKYLPSSSTYYNVDNIGAGQSINFNDSVQLCDGEGIETSILEIKSLTWD